MSRVLGAVPRRRGRRAAAARTQHGAAGFTEKIESVPGESFPPSAPCGPSLCISCGPCAQLPGIGSRGNRVTGLRIGRSAVAGTGLEEKYDAVRQLIAIGKERGYLLYDEVNDSLPAEVHSSEEIDDLLTTFERNGIEIYEDAASAKAARAVEVSIERADRDGAVKDDAHAEEGGSGSDLDLTPGSLEKTNDPV